MTFLDALNSKHISNIRQRRKMMRTTGCSNKRKKKWTPPNNYHTINIYVEAVKKDIEERKTVLPRKIRSNLSKDKKVALKYLSKADDIINTSADMGGAVVIMDVNDYIREGKRQLYHPRNYKVLAKDLATTNNNLIN